MQRQAQTSLKNDVFTTESQLNKDKQALAKGQFRMHPVGQLNPVKQKVSSFKDSKPPTKQTVPPQKLSDPVKLVGSVGEMFVRPSNNSGSLKIGSNPKVSKEDSGKLVKEDQVKRPLPKKLLEIPKKQGAIVKPSLRSGPSPNKNEISDDFHATNLRAALEKLNDYKETKAPTELSKPRIKSMKNDSFKGKLSPEPYYSHQPVLSNQEKLGSGNRIDVSIQKADKLRKGDSSPTKMLKVQLQRINLDSLEDSSAQSTSKVPSCLKIDSPQKKANYATNEARQANTPRGQRKNTSSVPTNKESAPVGSGLNMKLNNVNFNMSGFVGQPLSDTVETELQPRERAFKLRETCENEELKQRISDFYAHPRKDVRLFKTTLDFYEVGKVIGQGTYGRVHKAVHKLSGREVAIKTFEKTSIRSAVAMQKIFYEAGVLAKLSHPNIIKLYEIFENEKYYFFVTEFAENRDLRMWLQDKGPFTEDQLIFIVNDLISVAKYMRSKRVLHRDIKLDNILLDQRFKVKLCDFGISVEVKPDAVLTEKCGTPAYMPPEVIHGAYSGFSFDVCLSELEFWGVLVCDAHRNSALCWEES